MLWPNWPRTSQARQIDTLAVVLKADDMIRFHDPRGVQSTPPEPYNLALASENDKPTLALLSNGFPDSENFLRIVGEVLEEQMLAATVHYFHKGDPSIVASDDMLDGVSSRSDALVAAYGH